MMRDMATNTDPAGRSRYTGHMFTCATYATLDAGDCDCDAPANDPPADWELELFPESGQVATTVALAAWSALLALFLAPLLVTWWTP